MRNWMLVLMVLGVIGGWRHFSAQDPTARQAASHDRVIMYSLTTCGYCKQKARELDTAGIAFEEYYIDKDRARKDELNQKLTAAGFKPQRYGTPILDVHGVMLPNNPSLEKIREHL